MAEVARSATLGYDSLWIADDTFTLDPATWPSSAAASAGSG